MSTDTFISKSELLQHWLGHRSLTRKTIEKFPEPELFTFQIGGMRTFGDLVKEFLSVSVPGLRAIATGVSEPYQHNASLPTKEDLLAQWDKGTPELIEYFNQISEERLHESFKLFGAYELIIYQHILYFIDNEIHHRGQGFVYLRALNIEPPAFWDRY